MFRRRIFLLPALALAACDMPTQPPMWEQTWAVPGEAIELSVAELLPAGVDLNNDSTAFVAPIAGVAMSLVLSDMCPSCSTLDGLVAPKPEFDHTLSTSTSLPADLVSASLVGGSFDLVLAHSFNFDPLRPSSAAGAERGFLTVTITSNGNTVADTTIHGNDVAFPASVTMTPSLGFAPVDVANNLDLTVRVYSPAGDAVIIDSSDSLGITLEPSSVEIAEATIAATGIQVDAPGTSMDFSGVDPTLVDRIQGGELRFSIVNPFTLGGGLTLSFVADGQPVDLGGDDTLLLQQGTYETSLVFTGDALRTILNAGTVDVGATGNLSATGGTITVTPTQELIMDTQFSLDILVGGTGETN